MMVGHGHAAVSRIPASYIPDDDLIVKPVENEMTLYQQYVGSDKSDEVANARNQIKVWNDNQIFAEQYGLDTNMYGTSYQAPTQDEKWNYFKDRYFRYLKRKGEQPIKDMPKTWYNEYRASNEVDTIDELEARFQASQKKDQENDSLPDSLKTKEVKVSKRTRFIFQPRVDQGLVIIGIKGPIAHARAWVGANGETELNIQKSIDSIGFKAMTNYYAQSGKYFSSFDQRIIENVYARLTFEKDPANKKQNDTAMLLYAKQF